MANQFTVMWRKKLLMVLLFNTVIALLLTGLFRSSFIINFLFSQCIGLSIFSLQFVLLQFSRLNSALRGQWVVTVVAIFAGSVAGTVLALMLVGYDPLVLLNAQGAQVMQPIFIGLFFGVVISYFFYTQARMEEVMVQVKDEENKRLRSERQLTESRLKLMQAQIEPHFLFNTLANITSLVDSDSGKAKTMLADLNSYLRAALARTRDGETTLGEEINTVKAYLSIIKTRMSERLDYEILVSEDLYNRHLPPLLLQPLVENAVIHGLEPKIQGGRLTVNGYQKNQLLYLEVNDSGVGLADFSGEGVGMGNVRSRLKQLFGDKAQLNIRENQDGGVQTLLWLPTKDAI